MISYLCNSACYSNKQHSTCRIRVYHKFHGKVKEYINLSICSKVEPFQIKVVSKNFCRQ